MVIKGKKAQNFLTKITSLDKQGKQLHLAKITGNFKRSNE
jgi:hypothetical protein